MPKKQAEPTELMVVNDSPGEECRIAILEDGHLEELYSERAVPTANVGSIYKGRVVSVEPAIQAAFIDYGQGQNGFLHVSDLHPQYFPGARQYFWTMRPTTAADTSARTARALPAHASTISPRGLRPLHRLDAMGLHRVMAYRPS